MLTDVAGVTIIDIEPDRDDRGFFSDLFSADEFAKCGMLFNVAQTSVAYNYARGTLRGGRNVSTDGKRRATLTASHDTFAPQIAQPARYERETRPA
jgi:hypothetical protein